MPLRKLRLSVALVGVVTCSPVAFSQQPSQQQQTAGQAQPVQGAAPFAPQPAAALQRLSLLLAKWETESKNTKTLVSDFTRWHYDPQAAPAGRHATWGKGKLQYAAPDKGVFHVEELQLFRGMDGERPIYGPDENEVGEYWVCNGNEIIEFDKKNRKCKIQALPQELRGTQIFESPLPFVFNLDADKIQERYWVRELKPEIDNTYLLEAWPKDQKDRSQYLFVKIAVDAKTFLPVDLMLFAPNFHPQTNVTYDHYQFNGMSKNNFGSSMQQFMNIFIDAKPPRGWEVIRETYQAMPMEQAAVPGGAPNAAQSLR